MLTYVIIFEVVFNIYIIYNECICIYTTSKPALGSHTNQLYVAIMVSCVQVAYAGRHPSTGPFGELDSDRKKRAGREFSHGFRFALCECRGDWKWHRDLWVFRRHYNCNEFCYLCHASTKLGATQQLDTC